jgi:hypothetical protein
MKKLTLLSFCTILLLNSKAQQLNDSAAIRTVLEKEASSWRSGDAKAHASCWHIQPYSRILVSLADGTTFDVPPAAMADTAVHKMGNGGFAVMSNYKQKITGNSAWVSHNEESTDKDGNKTYSYEIRLLEKINKKWKLVGQSIHLYHPK